MSNVNVHWRIVGAALVAAASLAACGGDSAPPPPALPPPTPSTAFSSFAAQTFAMSADSTPVSLDGVNFVFDVNEDPTAFDGLIMSGVF